MKAISLHQPWASLIVEGFKHIETRSWAPPLNLVGQTIAIHAAKRKPRADEWNKPIRDILTYRRTEEALFSGPRLPLGCIVATAVIVAVCQVVEHDESMSPALAHCIGVYPLEPRTVSEDPFGDFSKDRYLWLLRDVVPLREPIPATGRQGFWDWNEPRVR